MHNRSVLRYSHKRIRRSQIGDTMNTLTVAACTVHGINRCTICVTPAMPSLIGFARETVACSMCGTMVEAGRQAYVTPWDAPNPHTVACAWHTL
jgi:hypothetical protein